MILFGIVFWSMVFAETYRCFPKMDKHRRTVMSATNATIMTAFLIIAVYLFMYLWFGRMIT